MSEENVPAALRKLASDAAELIHWYKKNKPAIKWIRVKEEHLKMLRRRGNEGAVRSAGFIVDDDGIYLGGFAVIGPTDPLPPERVTP